MAFTTLEQRFNESSKEIYNRFSNKNNAVTEIKPDTEASRSRIKSDTRLTPVVSTLRDASRISKFLKSDKGALFIAKQTLLQTGNTFAETRLYNPLETLLNVPPSVFVRRNLGFPSILGKNRGALQQETIDNFKGKASGLLNNLTNQVKSPINALNSEPELIRDDKSGQFFKRPEDNENWYPRLLAKQNITDQATKRPIGLYQQASKDTDYFLSEFSYVDQINSGSRTFRTLETTEGYFNNGDLYNIPRPGSEADVSTLLTDQISYDTIIGNNVSPIDSRNNVKSDIIKFIFSDADGSNPIHFRALISSIKEQIKPEYNEQRYVGRIERFVTYAGVKRSVSLQFNIAAMTPDELNSMWLRVNNLTARAFPKAISNSGFLVPPLFKITIGEIYNNQPCYIESLDYDFLDETITFDVDREISQVINVTMTLMLLEKRTKVYDSPFYKIMEDRQGTKERLAAELTTSPTSSAGERAEAQRTVRDERPAYVPLNPNGPPFLSNTRPSANPSSNPQRATTPFGQAFPQFDRPSYSLIQSSAEVNFNSSVRRAQDAMAGRQSMTIGSPTGVRIDRGRFFRTP